MACSCSNSLCPETIKIREGFDVLDEEKVFLSVEGMNLGP